MDIKQLIKVYVDKKNQHKLDLPVFIVLYLMYTEAYKELLSYLNTVDEELAKDWIKALRFNLFIEGIEASDIEEYILTVKTNTLFESKDLRLDFNIFWNNYHKVTGRHKTDKEPARKHWIKMKDEEKKLAIATSILEEHRKFVIKEQGGFFKKARTYLADKNFNDEYNSTYTRTITG